MESKTYNAILLSLEDEVLKDVSEETIAITLWSKLEYLYMKTSLANKSYTKKRLYTIHMDESKEMRKQINNFNKVILD